MSNPMGACPGVAHSILPSCRSQALIPGKAAPRLRLSTPGGASSPQLMPDVKEEASKRQGRPCGTAVERRCRANPRPIALPPHDQPLVLYDEQHGLFQKV